MNYQRKLTSSLILLITYHKKSKEKERERQTDGQKD